MPKVHHRYRPTPLHVQASHKIARSLLLGGCHDSNRFYQFSQLEEFCSKWLRECWGAHLMLFYSTELGN
ncbi:hypothetical protein ACVI1L_004796 [Bradyrhizobium sp. USDA 4516]